MILEECVSTNEEMKKYLHERSGFWILARSQTSGRGRLGRKWESQLGNLFLSVLLKVSKPHFLSWIPLAVSAATLEAVKAIYPQLDLKIKWPNDLYLGDGKAGGILCESQSKAGGPIVIVCGIGLNLKRAPDLEGIETRALDLPIQPEDLAPLIVHQILEEQSELELRGPHSLIQIYDQYAWLRPGTEIYWREGESGWVQDLGPHGELRVISPSGELKSLFSEEVKISKASHPSNV